jgi:LysR family transcriptional regulator, benzoate and cis,cis-muconate-responsive activator of ben and cat genes
MELRLLRYFQAIAEELSFSRASRRLRVAQPALSRALKELEEEIGAQLLERNRRKVSLTPAGAVLLHEASVLMERLEETLRKVRRTASGEEGELRLGYIGPPTQPFLGRLLHEYRTRYPKVSVHLEERTPERVWEMVAKGRLSIGLTRPVISRDTSGLQTLLLRAEPLCAVVPPAHPLASRASVPWQALASEPLIILARREGVSLHDEVLAGCRKAGFTPRIAQTPSLIGTVLSYVEAGAGIGIVTDSVALNHEGAALKRINLQPQQTVPLVMVWPEQESDPPMRAFRELVKEWIKAKKLWPVK